jgi:nicotinate-nucleotide pyrophosphorylase (carboxylating)
MVDSIPSQVKTEASGGITLDNVRAAAMAGVDVISIGALTHSVKALDISLELEPQTLKLF